MLALRHPDYFKTILAVTFTNKATEEMKARILDTLADISAGSHSMSPDLMQTLDIRESELKKRANLLLKNIIHNYSAFAVSTIDTFFQKVVRSFAREVGIQGGFKIELDQQKVIVEVIEKLMLKIDQDQELLKYLTQYAIHQINNGKNWDTRKNIQSLSGELFKELFLLHKEEIFEAQKDKQFLSTLINRLKIGQQKFEESYAVFGIKAMKMLDRHHLTVDDFYAGQKGVAGFMHKLANGNLPEPKKNVTNALENDVWYKKNHDKKDALDAVVASGFAAMVREALSFREKRIKHYLTIGEVLRYLFTFGLLSRINEEINDYREENELLLISDFPVFLNEIIHNSDTPYIYEKIGSRFNHYLMDEFQDTSGLQWNNFKPLIKDSLSANHFNMVVGDIKQSIYRWRGGDWKLLLDQVKKDVGEANCIELGLKTNRRSKMKIVEFNNDFFESIPELLDKKLTVSRGGESGVSRLSEVYHNSAQQSIESEGSGLVTGVFFDEETELDLQVQNQLIQTLNALQDANYQLSDIAILVRKKDEGRKVTNALMAAGEQSKKYRYDVVSSESLFLKNNAAIHLILQSMKYILDPSNAINRLQLEYAIDFHFGIRGNQKTFIKKIESLQFRDLRETVQQLLIIFEMETNANALAYLMAFQDAILEYEHNENGSIDDFLKWWEEHNDRSVQISDEQNAIRLLTIHKSKGLQFKIVIIPYCNWSLDHRGGFQEQILWAATAGIAPKFSLPYVPIKYGTSLADTEFAEAYLAEKSDIHLDNLNLLYVAMTRAEEGLYIFCSPPTKNSLEKASDLVYQYALKNELIQQKIEHSQTFAIGRLPGYTTYDQHGTTTVQIETQRKKEEENHDSRYKVRDYYQLDEEILRSINYGKIVHSILSQIITENDFEPVIDHAKVRYNLDTKALGKVKDQLDAIRSIREVSDWFSGKWKVKNEPGILKPDGHLRRPDRIMTTGHKAIIVDFKTGQMSDKHQNQLKEYRDLMLQMGYESVACYILYLNEPELVSV